jgi:hypothetical protein
MSLGVWLAAFIVLATVLLHPFLGLLRAQVARPRGDHEHRPAQGVPDGGGDIGVSSSSA